MKVTDEVLTPFEQDVVHTLAVRVPAGSSEFLDVQQHLYDRRGINLIHITHTQRSLGMTALEIAPLPKTGEGQDHSVDFEPEKVRFFLSKERQVVGMERVTETSTKRAREQREQTISAAQKVIGRTLGVKWPVIAN